MSAGCSHITDQSDCFWIVISGTRHSIGNGQVFQVITDVSGDSSPQIIQLNFIYMLLFCNVKSAIEKRKPRRSDDQHLSSTWFNSTVERKNLLEGSSIYNRARLSKGSGLGVAGSGGETLRVRGGGKNRYGVVS